MKLKLHLYLSNPEEYLKGEYDWCFNVRSDKDWTDKYQTSWIYLKTITIDPEQHTDDASIRNTAVDALDEEIRATLATAELKALGYRARIQNLLALEDKTNA